MALNQTGRLIRMTKGPLGPDEVVMTGFSGREAISNLFSFRLEFISTKLDLKPGEIIGKEVAIEMDRRDNRGTPLTPRYFHGYLSRFAAGNVVESKNGQHKYRIYRAEMVPWLWFLTQTARCFLFFPEKEDKSIFEIIEAVFVRAKSDLHVDPVNDLKGINDLKKRMVKHCVQYRETDFNFVSRTMERYGVFYYFKFEDGKHTLVVDMKKNYPNCEEAEVMYPRVTGTQSAEDHITDWQHDYEFVPGKSAYTDYNFEKPSTSLKADAPKLPGIDLAQNEKYEVYDYPGGYDVKGDGDKDARTRQEIEEVRHNIVNGESVCRTLTPGHKFKLKNHPDEDAVSEHNKSYLLTSVEHTASQPADDTRDSTADGYSNRFTCIPDSVQFRPERVTPSPQISGVQTAVVVGPEDIHTDKYGRVKVQFHWDREGKKDGNSSAWIRVSQNWGGDKWGGMFIPHVGQEVIVDFLEGDPDQPIIVGRVYNAEVMPPLELPANKTKSAIRDHGGNEIIMEGKDGVQQIRLFSPTANTKISLGAPNSPHELVCRTDGNGGWTCDGNFDTEVGKNSFKLVKANEEKSILGHLKDQVYGPFVIKFFWGFLTAFIGGFKTEVIVGAESKFIKGAKLEITNGVSIKNHKGPAYENNPTEAQKTSGKMLKQIGGTASELYGLWRARSKSKIELKAASRLDQLSKHMKFEAEALYHVQSQKIMLDCAARVEVEAKEHKVKAAKLKADADTNFNNGNMRVKQ